MNILHIIFIILFVFYGVYRKLDRKSKEFMTLNMKLQSREKQSVYVTGHAKKGLMRLFQVLEIIACCCRAIQALQIATCSVQIWRSVAKLSYVEELSF